MLQAIGAGRGCANQALCQSFPVSKATVSHHIRELVQAGLVEPEREGQFVSYRALSEVIKAYADELVRRLVQQAKTKGGAAAPGTPPVPARA